LAGADVHPQTGRLLSIAQLQAALRAGVTGLDRPEALPGGPTDVPPGPNRPRPGADAVVPGWLTALTSPVLVIGAHPGAGCSTVAVAVAEAAAAGAGAGAGAGAHLVEWSDGTGSGLAGVAHAELGVGPSGLWRHGRRGDLTVSRPVDVLPASPPDAGAGGGVVVVDLGHLGPTAGVAATAGRWPGGSVVVVCRASAPGVRRAEVLLAALQLPVLVAVVGPSRWPGSVRASRGPLLRQREEAGALVGVPDDRRLAVTGLTSAALPRKVAAAGDRLWQLTHTHPPGPPGQGRAR
jgi:hypothetical protein